MNESQHFDPQSALDAAGRVQERMMIDVAVSGLGRMGQINPRRKWRDGSDGGAGTQTGAGTVDPIMQAFIQQLEYTKPSNSTVPARGVNTVTVLPAQQSGGSSSSGIIILVVLVVIGGGVFLWMKSKKHGSHGNGGATHVEASH